MGGHALPAGDLQRTRTLIDGYNLMHAIGLMRPGRRGASDGELQQARTTLLDLLASSLTEEEARRTIVVFDAERAPRGLPSEWQVNGLTVLFAVDHESADELLEELIARHSAPAAVTVVSSDHRVQRAAKRRRATAAASEAWYEALLRRRQERGSQLASPTKSRSGKTASEEKPAGLVPDAETEYWLRQFSGDVPSDAATPLVERGLPEESTMIDGSAPDVTAESHPSLLNPTASHGPRAAPPSAPAAETPPTSDSEVMNPFPPDFTDDVWAEEGFAHPESHIEQPERGVLKSEDHSRPRRDKRKNS